MVMGSVREHVGGSAPDLVFYPTQAQASAHLRREAQSCCAGTFGTHVSTLRGWVGDLWELFGDGRRIVADVEREMLMASVFEHSPLCDSENPESISPRAAAGIAAECVARASGLPAFEDAVACPCESGLSESQAMLLEGVRAYYARLREVGLIEWGHVLATLPGCAGAAAACRARFKRALPFDAATQTFLNALDGFTYEIEWAHGIDGVHPASEGIDVRFAFPSGGYARARLLMRILDGHLGDGTAVITTKDPAGLFADLAPALLERDIPCAMQARVPFASTELGRVFFAVRRVVFDPEADKSLLSDFLFTSYSGLAPFNATAMDAAMRADRCKDAAACFESLRSTCRMLDVFEDLVQSPDADILLGVVEDWIEGLSGYDDAHRAQERAAVRTLRSVMEAGRLAGVSMDCCVSRLASMSVEIGACAGTSDARVLICSQRHASQGEPGSCDIAILCDMSSDAYPVKDDADSATVLLEELGIARELDAFARECCTFSALEELPSKMLVIERCLNDSSADPVYPCATVQEFVDCYRADTAAHDDIDNPYALPEQLRQGMFELGEEDLFENAMACETVQPVCATLSARDAGQVSQDLRHAVVLPRRSGGKDGFGAAVLSASQIEEYLLCPHLWFVRRRLRPTALDEGFGPVQKGSFVHHVLKDFYDRFTSKTGFARASVESLGAARSVMDEVLAEHVSSQYAMEPSVSNRLVAATELEVREVAELCDTVRDHLEFDAAFLPGFRPAYHELAIGGEDAVVYAGRLLTGSIDRIDVDDRGRAVIVDYKSSIGPEYALCQTSRGIPLKVQTLIYAQAVRRMLGLDVVGAVYVCYGKSHAVSGAFDARMEPGCLGGIKADDCGYMPQEGGSFADLLDDVEGLIETELDRMFSGDVAPAPASDSVCTWCPATGCLERRA